MQMRIAVCGALVGALASAAGAGVVFSDQEFVNADYDTYFTTGSAQTFTRVVDGGNSGTVLDPFRQVTTTSGAAVELAHINTTMVYDPALGAVDTIDFSIDAKAFNAFGQGMGFAVAARQNGVTFYGPGFITGSDSAAFNWRTFEQLALTAANFGDASGGGAALDFAGAPISFGFRTGNSGGTNISVGYDNLTVTVHPVPAPAAAVVLGCGALMGMRRRR